MDIPLLPDIVAIFCLSIGVLLVCHQVKIPPIVGFLLTGVLCGPTALGLVQNPHAVELLAEIGVVLLLFSIGPDDYISYSLNRMLDTGVGVAMSLLINGLLPRERLHAWQEKLGALRNRSEAGR